MSQRRQREGSVSFLVRFWREQADAAEEGKLRGYLRNLHTGEEQYLNDPEQLGEQIRRHLRASLQRQRAKPRTKSEAAG